MIKLDLLHSSGAYPVKSWSFNNKSIIKIGRSSNNHIIINSALISRFHVGIVYENLDWKIINFGSNGTYYKDKFITEVPVIDGMVICLCGAGPKIQIHLENFDTELLPKTLSSWQSSTKTSDNNLYSTFIRY